MLARFENVTCRVSPNSSVVKEQQNLEQLRSNLRLRVNYNQSVLMTESHYCAMTIQIIKAETTVHRTAPTAHLIAHRQA